MRFLFIAATITGCSKTIEETPWAGPDEVTTLVSTSEQVLFVVTHLRVRNAPGPGKRFGEHASAVGNDLFDNPRPGWLGVSFRNVGQLEWWTMSAWETEEDLIKWMVSEPHLGAIAAFSDVATTGENVSVWRNTADGVLPWDKALILLESPEAEYAR